MKQHVTFIEKPFSNEDNRQYKKISVEDFIKSVKNPESSKVPDLINQIRSTQDKRKNDELKRRLPAITPHGIFEGRRSLGGIVAGSGILSIDIDNTSKEEAVLLKKKFAKDKYTRAAFFSPNYGLKVLVKMPPININLPGVAKVEKAAFEAIQDKDEYDRGLELYNDGIKARGIKLNPVKEAFLGIFRAYLMYVKNNITTKEIDEPCKDLPRILYVSHDREAYFNPESILFNHSIPKKPDEKKRIPVSRVDSYIGKLLPSASENDIITHCENITSKYYGNFTKGNRNHFVLQFARYLNKYGISELDCREYIHSKYASEDFNEYEIDKAANYIYNSNNAEFATSILANHKLGFADKTLKRVIYQLVGEISAANKKGEFKEKFDVKSTTDGLINKATGSDDYQTANYLQEKLTLEIVQGLVDIIYEEEKEAYGLDNKPKPSKAIYYIRQFFELQHNVITDRPYYRNKRETGVSLKPINQETIFHTLFDNYVLSELRGAIKDYLASDLLPEYHPFIEGFKEMQPYNPELEGSYIDRLTEYITTSDQDFFKTMFKKHMVRSVKCSTTDYANRYCLTLISEKQNIGKSWFIRWLNPFDDTYYAESPIDHNNKDSQITLAETFIYNIEELATANKSNIDKLKSTLSLQYVHCRTPYDKYAKTRHRVTNFFASTNNSEFLVDSENTRWICVEVERIDFAYENDFNKEDIWREAYYLFQNKYNFELTDNEAQRLIDTNIDHCVVTAEEEMIDKYLRPAPQGKGIFVSASEIIVYLIGVMTPDEDRSLNMHPSNIGRGLKKLSFVSRKESINGKQKKGYWVYQSGQMPKSIEGLSNEQINTLIDDSRPKKQKEIKQNKLDFLVD